MDLTATLEAGVIINKRIRVWLEGAVENEKLTDKMKDMIKQQLKSSDKDAPVPFSLLKSVVDICGEEIYFHELLQGSELSYPKVPVKERDPILETRIKKLKAEQEHKEYSDMVKNVSTRNSLEKDESLGYQYKMLNRYLLTMINFVLTVTCVFVFGYKGMEYYLGHKNMSMQMMAGIVLGTVVFIADLYFILKNEV